MSSQSPSSHPSHSYRHTYLLMALTRLMPASPHFTFGQTTARAHADDQHNEVMRDSQSCAYKFECFFAVNHDQILLVTVDNLLFSMYRRGSQLLERLGSWVPWWIHSVRSRTSTPRRSQKALPATRTVWSGCAAADRQHRRTMASCRAWIGAHSLGAVPSWRLAL